MLQEELIQCSLHPCMFTSMSQLCPRVSFAGYTILTSRSSFFVIYFHLLLLESLIIIHFFFLCKLCVLFGQMPNRIFSFSLGSSHFIGIGLRVGYCRSIFHIRFQNTTLFQKSYVELQNLRGLTKSCKVLNILPSIYQISINISYNVNTKIQNPSPTPPEKNEGIFIVSGF